MNMPNFSFRKSSCSALIDFLVAGVSRWGSVWTVSAVEQLESPTSTAVSRHPLVGCLLRLMDSLPFGPHDDERATVYWTTMEVRA